MSNPFAAAVRDRQLAWALGDAVPVAALEERHGKVSWVLKPEFQKRNVFCPEWWRYVAGNLVGANQEIFSREIIQAGILAVENPARTEPLSSISTCVGKGDLDVEVPGQTWCRIRFPPITRTGKSFQARAYYSGYSRNKMESRKDQSESWAN
jgi:hypothetical protein